MGDRDRTEPRLDGNRDDGIIGNLQSMIIVFIVAFVFKHFVAEVYVIPTGSMAPTLLGAHMVGTGPNTGYRLHVSYGDIDRETQAPYPLQAPARQTPPIRVDDPMLDNRRYGRSAQGPAPIEFSNYRLRMGDRIFVLRYLYLLFEPERFDVAVFKGPHESHMNLIKRICGLPNESIWLADGDIFTSSNRDDLDSFRIERKPEHIQRELWLPVYHSEFVPVDPDRISPRWNAPWQGEGWDTDSGPSYRFDGAGETTLEFRADLKPITDALPYNEPMLERTGHRAREFAVSDLRMFAAIEPDEPGLDAAVSIVTRDHEFEARVSDERVELRMRPVGGEWVSMITVEAAPFPADQVTEVEFWHVDQALWLWIDGDLVARAEYDWSANDRLAWATGLSGDAAAQLGDATQPYVDSEYLPRQPRPAWRFRGSPLSMHRVELDRDIHYQPDEFFDVATRTRRGAARATAPSTILTLGPDEFFMCGDNSSSSNDSRLWAEPLPWVRRINEHDGIVPRELLLGKAFFVYFPSPEGLTTNSRRFLPGFGELRFIH
ncbi:MAG: S26 family signal peptidase [Phycisphaerales bacterium]